MFLQIFVKKTTCDHNYVELSGTNPVRAQSMVFENISFQYLFQQNKEQFKKLIIWIKLTATL